MGGFLPTYHYVSVKGENKMNRNVIVIGGSFAGLTAAFEIKRLLKDKVDVTLIASQEQFVFIPSFIG
jgi:NADH dehydrogenase FAD-containing subunit